MAFKKAEKWLKDNLNVVISPATDGEAIYWGDNMYTEVPSFLSMFGEIIEEAIDSNLSVKEAIINNDKDRGFAKYFE